MIGALAFLITPGFGITAQVVSRYAYTVFYRPSLVEPITTAVGIVFVSSLL